MSLAYVLMAVTADRDRCALDGNLHHAIYCLDQSFWSHKRTTQDVLTAAYIGAGERWRGGSRYLIALVKIQGLHDRLAASICQVFSLYACFEEL